jgi:pyruvate formate lyase activating enzyme
MKEALLYVRQAGGRVNCRLCAQVCLIGEGRRGLCGVRENRSGTLHSLVYGRVSALALDPVEKKPLYHFLPGSRTLSLATVGCNFKCAFCQNFSLSQAGPDDSTSQDISPEELVQRALASGASSISYTYSEPTIFLEYAYDIGKLARAKGLKNIFVTNGFMSEESYPFLLEFLDAANVDLKSFSDTVYRKVMGGRLEPVLENIRRLHASGVFLEVTTLLVPGLNDSEEEVRGMAKFLSSVSPFIPWHVSRFHPDYKMTDREPTSLASILRVVEIGKSSGLKFVYTGNITGQGSENTLCPDCGKLLVRRLGYTRPEVFMEQGRCPECGRIVPGLF